MKREAKDMRSSESPRSVDEGRMTEWLDPRATCGETGFPNCSTNAGWCECEVLRLKNKGVCACVVTHRGKIALFRPMVGEKASDIERRIAEEESKNAKGGD